MRTLGKDLGPDLINLVNGTGGQISEIGQLFDRTSRLSDGNPRMRENIGKDRADAITRNLPIQPTDDLQNPTRFGMELGNLCEIRLSDNEGMIVRTVTPLDLTIHRERFIGTLLVLTERMEGKNPALEELQEMLLSLTAILREILVRENMRSRQIGRLRDLDMIERGFTTLGITKLQNPTDIIPRTIRSPRDRPWIADGTGRPMTTNDDPIDEIMTGTDLGSQQTVAIPFSGSMGRKGPRKILIHSLPLLEDAIVGLIGRMRKRARNRPRNDGEYGIIQRFCSNTECK